MLPFANKALGQHFLTDSHYINRIIESITVHNPTHIIEIGPGPGALTKPLLALDIPLTVVEKDDRFAHHWEAERADFPHLNVIHADALTIDYTTLAPQNCVITGNLPYNVGTQIIMQTLQHVQHYSAMVFMLQKEVVQRICATPNTREWGRLGVWCDLYCQRKKVFDVPAGAFSPPPKVISSIVELIPRKTKLCNVHDKQLSLLLSTVFTQRRKMLRNTLKNLMDISSLNEEILTKRPENLTTAELCALAEQL